MTDVRNDKTPTIEELIDRIVFAEKEIDFIVSEQAKRAFNYVIENHISKLVFIVVKNGAIPYANKLQHELTSLLQKNNHKTEIVEDFVTIKSYTGTKSGEINVPEDITTDISGKFVLVIEDIEDSGKTLDFLNKHLKSKNPNKIRFSVFLKRGTLYQKDYRIDTGCYSQSTKWFVGFGLDFNGQFRDLPYLAEIKEKYMTESQ